MKTDFSQLRFNALVQSSHQISVPVSEPNRRSSLFGSHVFNDYKMLQYLTKDAIAAVRDAITFISLAIIHSPFIFSGLF